MKVRNRLMTIEHVYQNTFKEVIFALRKVDSFILSETLYKYINDKKQDDPDFRYTFVDMRMIDVLVSNIKLVSVECSWVDEALIKGAQEVLTRLKDKYTDYLYFKFHDDSDLTKGSIVYGYLTIMSTMTTVNDVTPVVKDPFPRTLSMVFDSDDFILWRIDGTDDPKNTTTDYEILYRRTNESVTIRVKDQSVTIPETLDNTKNEKFRGQARMSDLVAFAYAVYK